MKDVSELTKDELVDYVNSGEDFPVPNTPLNMKKSVETLRAEVIELQKQAEAMPEPTGQELGYMKNLDTGLIFPYTIEGFEHLKNAVRCDKDGNR